MAGVVEEVGPGVSEVKPGERVVVYYYLGCGRCRFCLRGEENLCENLRAEYSFITDGGFAQYVKVPARYDEVRAIATARVLGREVDMSKVERAVLKQISY